MRKLGNEAKEHSVSNDANPGRSFMKGGIELDAEKEKDGQDRSKAEVEGDGFGGVQRKVDEGVGDPAFPKGKNPGEEDVPQPPQHGSSNVGKDEPLFGDE